ncbi:hypothetical protein [Ktedonobacter robiniae]|uniref:TIGR04086 family membrane protein n=1 Tax=Ktedonobacter robiniae TaxID=2778365 RepID=A0ABQ3UIN7_9CHLR|nr:hypothetical protein [Ktedonobacter robiniae]GHO52604.1 hypothetical protein KSB_10790 [Ktedonobacter robiniae]
MAARISIMVLRLAVLVALILGIFYWAGNYIVRTDVHQGVGIIAVICLWIIAGTLATTKPGNAGIAIGAAIYGLIVIALGLTQDNILIGSAHDIIRTIHLLLGLGAIGFGEMLYARYKRI